MVEYALLGLALVDRFGLNRHKLQALDLRLHSEDENCYKFAVRFNVFNSIRSGQITYMLRDLDNPTTVLTGKPRSLAFSKKGVNSEFLIIEKSLFERCGKENKGNWMLDVELESSGSYINFLYKLLPFKSTVRKEFAL